jgi:serine/threonine protein kinase
MQIEPGTRLGPYEIVSPLGAGGMGEVWRAKDSRLERSVAVKILPPTLAGNAQLRARFEREARAISQLNHPHICTVHDVGNEQGTDFLVMELLEGETLADRLAHGPLPLVEVLRYGAQIADALDRAHRAGIVHRDLKPGNVMITKSGAKLLDFGLARSTASTLSNPETKTEHMPLTAEGTIVGTFQYMAPEQLAGDEADARTDIFALGAVLYEMLTGKRAFQGKTKTSLIGAIIGGPPPRASDVQPMTPPALEHIIMRCLAKEPDDRWQSAHDIAEELRWIGDGSANQSVAVRAPLSGGRRDRLFAVASVLLLLSTAALAWALWRERAKPRPLLRSSVVAPPDAKFSLSDFHASALSISPNGRWVTYAATTDASGPKLWIQDLHSGERRKLAEGHSPFWSPDSRSLAFWSGNKLRRMDVEGGPPVVIADGGNGRGGTWNADGTILYTPNWREPLHRVSANGGKSVPVTKLDASLGETTHRWPWFLPDGRHFLFLAGSHATRADSDVNAIYIGSLDSPERTLLLRARSNVVYANGHVLFVRENSLMAQPFDPDSRKLKGDPVRVAPDITGVPGFFRSAFAVSNDGALVHFSGPAAANRSLKWRTGSGEEVSTVAQLDLGDDLDLSPDDKFAAVIVGDPSDLWLIDLERRTPMRFTSDTMQEYAPVWSPDSSQLAYMNNASTDGVVMVKPIDGMSAQRTVFELKGKNCMPTHWSSDGRMLLVEVTSADTDSGDVWAVPIDGAKPYALFATPFDEYEAAFSPDMRWTTYVSEESGRAELYAVPYGRRGARRQLTATGVAGMVWLPDGREIRFATPDKMHMKIRVEGDTFGLPEVVGTIAANVRNFDFARDGRVLAIEEQPFEPSPVTLITNWLSLVRR